jgi:hypothetical protein
MSAVLSLHVAPNAFPMLQARRLKEQVDSWAEETLAVEWLTWRKLQPDSTRCGWAMRSVESDGRPGESHG